MANSNKAASKVHTETTEQLTEQVESEELSTKQSAPLSPEERANKAYILIYGENAELPIGHRSINTTQDADWFVRSYMGRLFAKPSDHPMTKQFNNLEELLTWFNETYPAQESEKVTEAE
jgi:hypothetical protein